MGQMPARVASDSFRREQFGKVKCRKATMISALLMHASAPAGEFPCPSFLLPVSDGWEGEDEAARRLAAVDPLKGAQRDQLAALSNWIPEVAPLAGRGLAAGRASGGFCATQDTTTNKLQHPPTPLNFGPWESLQMPAWWLQASLAAGFAPPGASQPICEMGLNPPLAHMTGWERLGVPVCANACSSLSPLPALAATGTGQLREAVASNALGGRVRAVSAASVELPRYPG